RTVGYHLDQTDRGQVVEVRLTLGRQEGRRVELRGEVAHGSAPEWLVGTGGDAVVDHFSERVGHVRRTPGDAFTTDDRAAREGEGRAGGGHLAQTPERFGAVCGLGVNF